MQSKRENIFGCFLSSTLFNFLLSSSDITLSTLGKPVNVSLAAAKSVREFHTSNDCVNPKNRGDPSDRKLIIVFQRIPRVFRGTAIKPGISHYLTNRKCHFSELFDCTGIPLSCWFHRRIIHWLDASRLFILPWLTFSVTSRI